MPSPVFTPSFGDELKRWRKARRMSQLALAAEAGVSQRHLSFLETGRSRPSREMVIHLATMMDIPLRSRNELLGAAGFAPLYSETGLEEPSMDQVRHVLEFLLAAHEPYPAVVLDRRWDLVEANQATTRLMGALIEPGAIANGPTNLARLAFHPNGLRRATVDWEHTASALLLRLEREVADRFGDQVLAELLEEVLGYPGVVELRRRPRLPTGDDLLLPIHYRSDAIDVRLFSTFSTIGASYDLTLEELRLETFFPADTASDAALKALAGEPQAAGATTRAG